MEIALQDICRYAKMRVRQDKSKKMREQYGENTIVLFTEGEWYVAFGDSALLIESACGFNAIQYKDILMYEFPIRSDYVYFARLVAQGYKLCVIE